ncbi:MAG: hypothetical protein QOJ15_9796, partial [Bradyrhizobium sp.]|nr:hypothetical protein [Bradyrhizobium sp.]
MKHHDLRESRRSSGGRCSSKGNVSRIWRPAVPLGMVVSVMERMAGVMRPGLRCGGKGEDERRQDRGDPDAGGRLHNCSLPECVHEKAPADIRSQAMAAPRKMPSPP